MRDINTLHPIVKAQALALVDAAKTKLGLRIIITECLRTAAEQAALYAQGRKTLAQINLMRRAAGMGAILAAQAKLKVTNAATVEKSYHGYGLAFDIAVTSPDGRSIDWSNRADWNKDSRNDWVQVGELAADLGLEWGGNWTSFPDLPHYQNTMKRTIANLIADPAVVAGTTYKGRTP